MKLSLLQSLIFSIFILQASWCCANTQSSNGENLTGSQQIQAEKTNINANEHEKISQCEKYPALQGIRRIKCAQKQSISPKSTLVQDSIGHPRRFKRTDSMEIMSFSHGGGHGGGSGGGGGSSGGAGGGQSNHQTHGKRNDASSLSHSRIYFMLEIGVYAVISLSFSMF